MEFNLNKCKDMHSGKLNQGRTYTVNSGVLGSVVEPRDLRVQVQKIPESGDHNRKKVIMLERVQKRCKDVARGS